MQKSIFGAFVTVEKIVVTIFSIAVISTGTEAITPSESLEWGGFGGLLECQAKMRRTVSGKYRVAGGLGWRVL